MDSDTRSDIDDGVDDVALALLLLAPATIVPEQLDRLVVVSKRGDLVLAKLREAQDKFRQSKQLRAADAAKRQLLREEYFDTYRSSPEVRAALAMGETDSSVAHFMQLTERRWDAAISAWTQREAILQNVRERLGSEARAARQREALIVRESIAVALGAGKLDEARRLRDTIDEHYPQAEFEANVRPIRERIEQQKGDAAALANWIDIIEASGVLRARKQYLIRPDCSEAVFREARICAARDVLLRLSLPPRIGESNSLSAEQLDAASQFDGNVLLTARAGSGKTTVVAARAALLLKHEQLDPATVMVVAFNRTAARGVGDRIGRNLGNRTYANARTFHSLAWAIVDPPRSREPLFDEDRNEVSQAKRSLFVQRLVRDACTPTFRQLMYKFFRAEVRELDVLGEFLSPTDRYLYVRALPQVTLAGERVKSLGEKYIADFLFEHGIDYKYEPTLDWDDREYRPDFGFVLSRRDIYWEHWAITLPEETLPAHWDVSAVDYLAQRDRKRAYWRKRVDRGDPVMLIESAASELGQGRESFEAILAERMCGAGVALIRLPQHELEKAQLPQRISTMSKLFGQFISRAKKHRWTPDNVRQRLEANRPEGQRTRVFAELACNMYEKYESALVAEGRFDFDDLLARAADRVRDTRGAIRIPVGLGTGVAVRELRHLLIDEFQDLSPLFFDLVSALREQQPELQLFGVGDDWQAINSFAGANLKYFLDFESLVRPAKRMLLLANRRCASNIVDLSNQIMGGLGHPAQYLPDTPPGRIWRIHTGDMDFNPERDRPFLPYPDESDWKLARAVKACFDVIITDTEHKTFAVLARTGRVAGVPLSAFESRLRSLVRSNGSEATVTVSTVHGMKGGEADVVFLLFPSNRAFPLIHPDDSLFSIFGRTGADTLAEERRLLYVALTRAKRELFFITDENGLTDFVPGTAAQTFQLRYDKYEDIGLPGTALIQCTGKYAYSIREALKARAFAWDPKMQRWIRAFSDLPAADAVARELRADHADAIADGSLDLLLKSFDAEAQDQSSASTTVGGDDV